MEPKSVKAQVGMWEKMLELRIHAQRIVTDGARLPQTSTLSDFTETNEEVQDAAEATVAAAKRTLDSLLELRDVTASKIDSVDWPPRRRAAAPAHPTDVSTDEYWADVEAGWEAFGPYRDTTVDKWARKMQVGAWGQSAKKFSVLNQQLTKQVDAVLAQTHRVHRRTRAKRGSVVVFGSDLQPAASSGAGAGAGASADAAYDPEIYDDSEFYHSLLQAFIDSTATGDGDGAGGTAGGRKKRKSSKKKTAERGASKGRKLRYHVHPKIVNFVEPTKWPTSSVDMDTLLSSLFQ